MARVLVTGGAGFIGSHVVEALVDCGHEVRVLDALLPAAHAGPPEGLRSEVHFVRGDLRDAAIVREALRGVDAVSHQAAMVGLGSDFLDVADYVAHNALGTAVLLRELATSGFRGPFVLAGSMVIYGEGRYVCARHGPVSPPPRSEEDLANGTVEPRCPRCGEELRPECVTEDTPSDPRDVYAATKLHTEHLCRAFSRVCGNRVTAQRYHNVYGPRMPRDTPYAGVAAIFRSCLERGEAPQVFEDGRQLRDFVHVRDVARANVLALAAGAGAPDVVNVASGRPRTVGDMARALWEATGAGAPAPVVTGGYRAGHVRHVFA